MSGLPAPADWSVLVPVIAALVGIIGVALRALIRLQRAWADRDDAVAKRERKQLEVMEDISRPLRQIPPVLEAQRNQLVAHGEALRHLREEQQHSFRTLSTEIRDTGTAAREATRELMAEIRAAFRTGNGR